MNMSNTHHGSPVYERFILIDQGVLNCIFRTPCHRSNSDVAQQRAIAVINISISYKLYGLLGYVINVVITSNHGLFEQKHPRNKCFMAHWRLIQWRIRSLFEEAIKAGDPPLYLQNRHLWGEWFNGNFILENLRHNIGLVKIANGVCMLLHDSACSNFPVIRTTDRRKLFPNIHHDSCSVSSLNSKSAKRSSCDLTRQ